MRWSNAAAVGAAAAAVLSGATAQAAAPDTIRLRPVDGAHWAAHAGLPDSRGSADQALVRVVDGSDRHPEVAVVRGVEGSDTAALTRVGFATPGELAGIIPCIRIAYTDAAGIAHEHMVTTREMRSAPVAGRGGWVRHTADLALPAGGTVDVVELALHVELHPPEPVRVALDDVLVGERVITHAGDAGVHGQR